MLPGLADMFKITWRGNGGVGARAGTRTLRLRYEMTLLSLIPYCFPKWFHDKVSQCLQKWRDGKERSELASVFILD